MAMVEGTPDLDASKAGFVANCAARTVCGVPMVVHEER